MYLEVYGPQDAAKELRLEIACQDAFNARKFNIAVPVVCSGRVTPVTAQLPVAEPALHGVPQTHGRGRRHGPVHRRRLVRNPLVNVHAAARRLPHGGGAASLHLFRRGTQEAPGHPRLRNQAWQDFWDKRDPTPGSTNNEYRDEF